jgi:eukaryotic-like serine/threonine-protein kinase
LKSKTPAPQKAATTTSEERPVYTAEKARLPLVWKLFGLMALVIALVVGVAVLVTIQRANAIAGETVKSSISSAAGLYKRFEKQRLGELALSAEFVGNDPSFAPYIEKALGLNEAETIPVDSTAPVVAAPTTITAPAPTTITAPAGDPAVPTPASPVVDLASIADQLEQRRSSFGTDLVALLDDQGRVIVRTDQPAITTQSGEDLYESSPLVKKIVDDASVPSSSGVMKLGDQLYHAAVAPVGLGQPRKIIGYLINAYAINEAFANQIAEATKAGVMFASATDPKSKSAHVARSANAPSVGMGQLAGVDEIFRSRKMLAPSNVKVDGSSFVMTGEPLVAGGNVLGAAVFVRSLDRELAPFKQIENTMLAVGGIALLFAFLISWIVARRLTRPIEDLAGMAQAVTAGDYDVHPKVERSDEVGILARAFAQMISSLRDKAELEELYADMASRVEDRESKPKVEAPARAEGAILVTEIRGVAENATGEVDALVATLTKVMKLQEAEIVRQEGEVGEVSIHRMVSVFRGERGVTRAIRAARAINEELAAQPEFGTRVGVGIGIASGTFVTGVVPVGRDSGRAFVGSAPLLALIFASNAPSGQAYIALDAVQLAGSEVAGAVVRQEVRLSWLQQPIPVGALPLVSVTTGMIRTPTMSTNAGDTMRMDGASSTPVSYAEITPGAYFANRYRVEQIIGRGGMGVVYRAVDTQLDETVAIKTLPGDVMQRSPEEVERFKREIRLARKITHRNVLRTYDYGEADGVYFISMEFVRGYTLAEMLEESDNHALTPRLGVGVSRQICRGLDAAHEQGIIHRDIKPQNVLIDAKGEIKLMDFGIARMAEAPEAMTQQGLIVGTPHYMSPEQVQGKALDPRSDVYAMGVLMYEMMAGKRPFESSSLTGILAAHITEQARPPIELRPEIGRELNAIIMKCLAKDLRERFTDAGELLAALETLRVPALAAA